MKPVRLLCLASALSLLSARPISAQPASVKKAQKAVIELAAFDEYYGIYVSGQKVGWMRSRFAPAPKPLLSTELHAKVSGMGKVEDIELREERLYNEITGLLESIDFSQRAVTGQVQVVGKRDSEGVLRMDTQAGGATRSEVVNVPERLSDALATVRLALGAKVGTKMSAIHFDPSIQKVVRVEHTVLDVQKRSLAGVESQAVKIQTVYPDLGVSETAWLDSTGKMLESQIGGFFIARLEPPDVAKRLDYHQDLLISAVVRAPRQLVAPQNVQSLTLTFTGFGEQAPPTTPRQEVAHDGNTYIVTLHKDPPPPRTKLAPPTPKPADIADVKDALTATAFIQSDAPELIAAAKKAIGSARDIFTASTRLVDFVSKHIHSEYVPAFSNALEAYQSARGDCTEHSILYVAMARAVGIPARVAVGIAYWPPGDGFGWHAWAEIYVAGRWLAVDPTWRQPIADATHVKLADGGPAQQARIVMLLGELKISEMKSG